MQSPCVMRPCKQVQCLVAGVIECVLKPLLSSCRASPADDGIGEFDESKVVLCMNFIANLQPTKQVVPTVRSLHHPPPSLEARILFQFLGFLAARFNMGDVSTSFRRPTQFRIVIAFIATKMLARLGLGRRPRDDNRIQRGAELLHVMPVGARERHRQRDALGVREQVPLGAQFAPIGGVFAGLIPPLTGAETVALSSDWKRQSMPWRSS